MDHKGLRIWTGMGNGKGVGFLIGGLYPYLVVYLYRDVLVSEGDVLEGLGGFSVLCFYFYRFFIVGDGEVGRAGPDKNGDLVRGLFSCSFVKEFEMLCWYRFESDYTSVIQYEIRVYIPFSL